MSRLLGVLILLICSCNNANKSNEKRNDKVEEGHIYDKKDSLEASETNSLQINDEEKLREREIKDSLKLAELQKLVFAKAEKLIGEKNITDTIGIFDAYGYSDYAVFEIGNVFSNNKKHLLVKRYLSGSVWINLYSDIYLIEGKNFRLLVSDTADYGFDSDTLQDVNKDGYLDYMVSTYSGAGCCPRDSRIAYLYNNKTGGFETVDFFNPEFDSANNFVYEMSYGRPGDVQLEKSKWIGFKKVLIESVSPTLKDGMMNNFVEPYTYTITVQPDNKEKIVDVLPKEYLKLKNCEYFLGYQN